MRHGIRSALGILALVGALGVAGLATATCAFACTCMPPGDVAAYRGQEDIVVLAGTVAMIDANQVGTFQVERWYQGGDAPVVPIRGGQGADCGLPLTAGQHLVLIASVEVGTVQAGVCLPSGDLSTPDGRKLAGEVAAAFGPGSVPDAGGGDEDDGSGGSDGIDASVVLAVGIAAVLLVVSVLAFGRRERPEAPRD